MHMQWVPLDVWDTKPPSGPAMLLLICKSKFQHWGSGYFVQNKLGPWLGLLGLPQFDWLRAVLFQLNF